MNSSQKYEGSQYLQFFLLVLQQKTLNHTHAFPHHERASETHEHSDSGNT